MTLDNVWEQKPKQWRIDHPDFQDVMKTTFLKGEIIEFEEEEKEDEDDERVRIKSMVKVKTEKGESEGFIPIFWKPKEKYWDDEEVLAEDYDEDNQCYKKAWMCFNGNDDVIVMCDEDNVPKAVLGFYDNYPRIGENIVKMRYTASILDRSYTAGGADIFLHPAGQERIIHLIMWPEKEELIPASEGVQEHKYCEVNEEPVGPDGKDLGLLKKCEKIGGWSFTKDHGYHQLMDYAWDGTKCGLRFGWWELTKIDNYTVEDFLVPVGGILYIFSVTTMGSRGTGTYCDGSRDGVEWSGSWEGEFSGFAIFSAPYTKENKEKALGGPSSTGNPGEGEVNKYDGFKLDAIPLFIVLNGRRGAEFDERDVYNMQPGTIEFYVRPHTKEELEEAGLWPEIE